MSKRFIFLFILFAQLTTAFTQIDPLLQTAYEKLNKRNFEGALQDFNQILLINPASIEALCGRAEAKTNLGNYPEALKDADFAIALDKSNVKALVLKGEILLNQKDYNNAQKIFDQVLGTSNPPAGATIGKAKCLSQMGNVKESYRLIDNAIDAQPTNPEFYYARGILNSSENKYVKALQDFEKASKLNPNFNPFGIALNSGIACLNLEEIDNSVEYLNKAVELDPLSATARQSRGLAYYAQENFKESVDDFLKSYELNPGNEIILFNLGMAYYKLNDPKNACFYFHKSCQAGNTNSCQKIIMVCGSR